MMIGMTPEDRAKLMRLHILRILDQCGGYMLSEQMLFAQLNIELRPPAATAEFSSSLAALAALRLAGSIRPELGGGLCWKITDKGRLALAENYPS